VFQAGQGRVDGLDQGRYLAWQPLHRQPHTGPTRTHSGGRGGGFGHAGLAALHHLLGSDILLRMFWIRRGITVTTPLPIKAFER
jgi:hypothetical protein